MWLSGFVLRFAGLALCIHIIVFHTAFAQHRPFKFTRFTIEDGLSQSSVGHIFEDRFGFIWIATEDGVNRYDGTQFKVYRHDPKDSTSIKSSWVSGFFEDRQGRLWLRPSAGGLSLYDRDSDAFRNISVGDNSPSTEVVYDGERDVAWYCTRERLYSFDVSTAKTKVLIEHDPSSITWFTIDGDTGWAINSSGLYRIDLDSQTAKKIITGLAEVDSAKFDSFYRLDHDDKGRIYFGGRGVLYVYDPVKSEIRSYRSFRTKNNGLVPVVNQGYLSPLNQSGKYFWIITLNYGVFRLNEEDENDVVHYFNSPEFPLKYSISDNRIHYPSEARDSVFWLTSDNGINYFDEELDRFVFYHHSDKGSSSSRVNSYNFAYTDRIGNVWLSTRLDGVSMIPNKKKFRDLYWFYDRFIQGIDLTLADYSRNLDKLTSSLGNSPVRDMLEELNGNIWFCTDTSVVRLQKSTGEIAIFHSGTGFMTFPAKSPGDLLEDSKGRIWFLPFDGRPGLLNESKTAFEPYEPLEGKSNEPSFVYAGFEDRKGNLWIGDAGFINILNIEKSKAVSLRSDPGFRNQSARFWYQESDSLLWIGATDKLVRHNPLINTFTDFRIKYQGMSQVTVYPLMAMAVDSEKNFWIGTYGGGLVYLNPKTNETKNYRVEDGLPNDYILELQFDGEGYLWASTNQGLARLELASKEFERFNTGDGTVSREFNAGASLFTKDGIMLFGGTNGLTAFRPEEIEINPAPPQVVLTAFKKFNTEVKLTPGIQVAEEIEIDYKDNLISFEFTALNFINPDSNKYAYMLEGFDDLWIENGSKKEAYFTNLDPGEYTFRVKASNNDGVWNEKGASVRLVINPPFYMTWWFKTIILFTMGAFAYFLYAMRIRNIRAIDAVKIASQARSLEQEKVIKTEISRNLHDEVNTELTLIGNKCLELSGSKLITPELKTELQSLRLLSLQIRGLIDDVIWFIRPENESGEKMISKLTSTIGGMLKFTDYELDIDEDLFEPGYEVDIHIKKQLYLILKEVLNNIVKHSEATLVGVRLWREGDIFNMTINDNGKGFDMEQKIMGSGLRNIRDRAADISAKLIVESSPGEGVRVSLNVSLRRVESESAKK